MSASSRSVCLKRAHIRHLAKFSDPSFDLIVDFLISKKVRLHHNYGKVYARLPAIDKIYWSADRPLLPRPMDEGQIHAHDVLHHGFHILASCLRKQSPKGFPRFALFVEALASAADVYFSAIYFNRYGSKHPIMRTIKEFEENSKRQKRPFLRVFQTALKDPFAAYKANVDEIYQTEMFCFEIAARPARHNYHFADELEALAANMYYWGITSRLDYHTFAFHTLLHCGHKTTAQDRRLVAELQDALRAAESLDMFLKSLISRTDLDQDLKNRFF